MSGKHLDFYRDRRVLVTGGLGFIGSNLCRRLVDLGAQVTAVDSLLPDYGGNGLYTRSYGYRSVALRKPRVCVYHRGPNICEPMPANGSETEWSSYDRLLRPYLDSVETRLYLYGPRDLAGKEQAIVQYRDVSLVPNATATAVVITRIAPSTAPADPIAWEHTTPASYSVTADSLSEGTVVALVETNAPGWVLTGLPDGNTATKVRLNGHQNAWIIDQDVVGPVDIRLAYPPAFTARKVLKLSMLALLGIATLKLR